MLDQSLFRHCGTEEIDGLVGTIDDTQEVLRMLLYAIQDSGGSIVHLNRLIKEARQGRGTEQRKLLWEMAKIAVGDIWDFVRHPFDLAGIWNPNLRELSNINPMARETKWEREKPVACQYKLVHFHNHPSLAQVANFEDNAGYSELLAFRGLLESKKDAFVRNCRILALGSKPRFSKVRIDENGLMTFYDYPCEPEKDLAQLDDFILVRVK